jgi:A/G-specific adenine glycosylase
MELGATICGPAAPSCARCPVAADCAGRAAGVAAQLPVRRPARAAVRVHARAVVAPVRGGILALRIPGGEPNAGQFELPGPGLLHAVEAADLAALLRDRCGARIEVGPALATIEHAITNHRIRLTAHAGAVERRGRLEVREPADLDVPWTTATRKVLARIHDVRWEA